jgi:hypothetical protein
MALMVTRRIAAGLFRRRRERPGRPARSARVLKRGLGRVGSGWLLVSQDTQVAGGVSAWYRSRVDWLVVVSSACTRRVIVVGYDRRAVGNGMEFHER